MSCWDLPFTACVKTHAKLQHDQRTVSFSIHLGQSTLHHTKLFSNVHSLNKIFLYVRNQASLSVEFSRQAYWSELPFHSPGDVPDPGIEPRSPALQADSLPAEPPIVIHIFSPSSYFDFSHLLLFSLTLCDPMDCSTPGFPVSHCLSKFAQLHVL